MTFLFIILVVFAFGLLIFVHELGHFLAAKRMGVRVEVFSLGFGPYLWKHKRGETMYAVSLVPFGGYVKMTGQADAGSAETSATDPHDWTAKRPWERAVILVCGVLMNAVLAFVALVVAYRVGIDFIAPEVGALEEQSAEYQAGLRESDVIREAGGRRIKRWKDLMEVFAFAPRNKLVPMTVEREGETVRLEVEPYYDKKREMPVPGFPWALMVHDYAIGCTARDAIHVLDVAEASPAEEVGLLAGDIILELGGIRAESTKSIRKAVGESGGEELSITVVRDGRILPGITIKPKPKEEIGGVFAEKADKLPDFVIGIEFSPSPVRVLETVQPGSPAAEEGIRPGDVIVSAQALSRGRLGIEWKRGKKESGKAILVQSEGCAVCTLLQRKTVLVRRYFFDFSGNNVLLVAGCEWGRLVANAYKVVRMLVSRRLHQKHLGGPIAIAHYTYLAAKKGMGQYAWFIGFISVSLAVLNLLPMPPLDGGLLVFEFVEQVRGKPAGKRVREVIQMVGLILLLALVLLVTKNDIGRWISQ